MKNLSLKFNHLQPTNTMEVANVCKTILNILKMLYFLIYFFMYVYDESKNHS